MMENDIYTKKPTALKRLGEDVFIDIPLYESKKRYKTVYVNEALFQRYFEDDHTDFEHMANVIERYFSTTIEKEKSTGKRVGTAYVDKQADPLGISLNNNLGSGRAYYQYDIFNVKGEKTPLATSPRDDYSNGVLEFEKSIYETIASNSLFEDVTIQLSPILAILDIHEECRVFWKDRICKRAKIIRIDLDGSLDRITHVFQANQPLSKDALLDLARKIGELEGEKFLHRINHGAWSAGNISPKSHMIDFDTVCAVKYRAPQFSFTKKFIENYFGLEYLGQLKIIRSLVETKSVNVDDVDYTRLEKVLLQSRERYIHTHFAELMGFKDVSPNFMPQIRSLVEKFSTLTVKCYPVWEDLNLKCLESEYCAPFNFSRFFRYYPILRRHPDWDPLTAFSYMLECMKEVPAFTINDFIPQDGEEAIFKKNALIALEPYFINSYDDLLALSQECLEFITDYDELYTQLLENSPHLAGEAETNAYIINQDRTRLFMPHSIAGPIDDEKDVLPYKHLHKVIQTTILANKRRGSVHQNGLKVSNMTVFKQGYFATLHDQCHNHKISLNLFEDCFSCNSTDTWEVMINEKSYPCEVVKDNQIISIESPFFDNIALLPGTYQDIRFFRNDHLISLDNFIFVFTTEPQISSFADCVTG